MRTVGWVLVAALVAGILGIAGRRGRVDPLAPVADGIGGTVAFVDANVLPMEDERVLEGYTVIVEGGVITGLAPSEQLAPPAGATVIDAAGRYLIPSFADVHVHLGGRSWDAIVAFGDSSGFPDAAVERELYLYLAHGVTLVECLSAAPEHIELREEIRRGDRLGPQLVLARMIDGPGSGWPPPISDWVSTPAEARRAVERAAASGYDRIKVYSYLSRESYAAVMAAAAEFGLPVDGHLPFSVSLSEAIAAGQRSIAHAQELVRAIEPATGDGIVEVVRMLVEHGVWLTPTLAAARAVQSVLSDPGAALGVEEGRYLSAATHAIWRALADRMNRQISSETQAALDEAIAAVLGPLTVSFAQAGGRFLIGTDAMLPGVVPGASVHTELEALVAAGVAPCDALRAATSSPREFLGQGAGTITIGARLDLVMLGGDPLQTISHTREIDGVLVGGRWIPRSEIEDELDAMAEAGAVSVGADHPDDI